MQQTPIHIIPWQKDFFTSMADYLCNDLCNCESIPLHETTIIFPHNRPARYLKKTLAGHDGFSKPMLLPELCSLSDFTAKYHQQLIDSSARTVTKLDQISLLYSIVEDLHDSGSGMISALPLDRERFFPWGIRLAALLEELNRQQLTPGNVHHLQGEVIDWAAALLEQISTLQAEYAIRLQDKGWTTPATITLDLIDQIDVLSSALSNRRVIIAGFYALSSMEDTLFKALWSKNNAEFIWHSDPALANDTPANRPHWATAEHKAWMKRWKTLPQLAPSVVVENTPEPPHITFIEACDRHTQLEDLTKELSAGSLSGAAVVLPDTGALPPVLHGLPEEDVNISMGYPLDRTSLYQLIDGILTAHHNSVTKKQEDDTERVTFHIQDVINVIRHPYLKMLPVDDAYPLRTAFHQLEIFLREQGQYVSLDGFVPIFESDNDSSSTNINNEDFSAQSLELYTALTTAVFTGFQEIQSLDDLAQALHNLCTLLAERGGDIWQRYLLDAECLFRMISAVIPELSGSEMSHEDLPQSILFSFLRQLLTAERVSFEPDPLSGLQILGMLETRLLRFDNLYIMDAVEEKLPGTSPYDPLLPDQLRSLLGLPDNRERDNVAGYNFYRLVQGAKNVSIFYQSGTQPGILDSKNVRSRYVEQLLWEQEKELGKAITPDTEYAGNIPLRTVSFPAKAVLAAPAAVQVSPAMRTKLSDMLETGISPSALESYLTCPKKFFFQYLTKLKPLDTLDFSPDKGAFGTAVHKALQDMLTPYIDKKVKVYKFSVDELVGNIFTILKENGELERLAWDTQTALQKTTEMRMRSFLEHQPELTIKGLEKKIQVECPLDSKTITLKGFLDRIDERQPAKSTDEGDSENSLYIVDYKTGKSISKTPISFWDNKEILTILAECDLESYPNNLLTLRSKVQGIQMPVYLTMYTLAHNNFVPEDALWIPLAGDGKEKPLFGEKADDELKINAITKTVPALLNYLVFGMMNCSEFFPSVGRQCQWCDFRNTCM
ncbi:MAG: PD-(D/E)XK nuclease family protein [Desulfovibrio sp.]